MVYEIVKYGDPVLRTKGKRIGEIDDGVRQLAADMLETMYAAHGLGLAAQQIGLALQITVVDVVPVLADRPSEMFVDSKAQDLKDWMPMVLINPVLQLDADRDTASEDEFGAKGEPQRPRQAVTKGRSRQPDAGQTPPRQAAAREEASAGGRRDGRDVNGALQLLRRCFRVMCNVSRAKSACSLAAIVLALLPCRSAATGDEPNSHIDESPRSAQTPATLGYVKQITILIKSTWAHSIDQCVARHVDVPYGKVVVHLSVDRDGKANNPRVVSGEAGGVLSQISLDAVSNAQLPAMSAEAIQELNGKRVPMDVTFELLREHNHRPSPH